MAYPVITSVNSTSTPPFLEFTTTTLDGSGFGAVTGTLYAVVGLTVLEVSTTFWSDTLIEFEVPPIGAVAFQLVVILAAPSTFGVMSAPIQATLEPPTTLFVEGALVVLGLVQSDIPPDPILGVPCGYIDHIAMGPIYTVVGRSGGTIDVSEVDISHIYSTAEVERMLLLGAIWPWGGP
jgi:hypothetical protein